jgi:hypothetical protein
MTTKLTDEQRRAVEACAGQPVVVADEATQKLYYLLNEEALLICALCKRHTMKHVAQSCALLSRRASRAAKFPPIRPFLTCVPS